MAVSHAFVQLVLALALVPTLATSKQFIVGDGYGWTTGVDYVAWARGKDFRVGDTLLFQYDAQKHNVNRVAKAGFGSCKTIDGIAALDSGRDEITLSSAGQKWYICGVQGHCQAGQKLYITVQNSEAPAPWLAPAAAPPRGQWCCLS